MLIAAALNLNAWNTKIWCLHVGTEYSLLSNTSPPSITVETELDWLHNQLRFPLNYYWPSTSNVELKVPLEHDPPVMWPPLGGISSNLHFNRAYQMISLIEYLRRVFHSIRPVVENLPPNQLKPLMVIKICRIGCKPTIYVVIRLPTLLPLGYINKKLLMW